MHNLANGASLSSSSIFHTCLAKVGSLSSYPGFWHLIGTVVYLSHPRFPSKEPFRSCVPFQTLVKMSASPVVAALDNSLVRTLNQIFFVLSVSLITRV